MTSDHARRRPRLASRPTSVDQLRRCLEAPWWAAAVARLRDAGCYEQGHTIPEPDEPTPGSRGRPPPRRETID